MNKITEIVDMALGADSLPECMQFLAQGGLQLAVRGHNVVVINVETGGRHRLRTCGRHNAFIRSLAKWDEAEYTFDLTRSEFQLLALRTEWIIRSNYEDDINFDEFDMVTSYLFELPRGTIHDILELAFRGRGNPFEDFCRRCDEAITAAESPYSVH